MFPKDNKKIAEARKAYKEKHGCSWSENERRLREARKRTQAHNHCMVEYLRQEKDIYTLPELKAALGDAT